MSEGRGEKAEERESGKAARPRGSCRALGRFGGGGANPRLFAPCPVRLRVVPACLIALLLPLSGRGETAPGVGDWSAARTVCRPVPLRDVKLGGFLGARVDANNRVSIPAGLTSAIPAAFEARARGEEPPTACRRLATDSDFYKWFEGACYAIAYDPSLTHVAEAVDRHASIFVRLQEKDGYLGTRLSPAGPFDEKVHHDLCCAGHFIEAAVAHWKATGTRTLLDAACRLADFYRRADEAGHPYFRSVGRREHPEIEPALVRLYRATGEKRFLDFAGAVIRMSRLGPTIADVQAGGGSRHAVRLCYLMTGAAEAYVETGDRAFHAPLPGLWEEIVSTRMYVTGGIGYNESIAARPFDLPQCLEGNPSRDIAETCASVAMMMFSWRMHAITGESRYFDTIETILYNHYLGAVSPDHLGIFYYNPLRRVGDMAGRTDHGGNPVRRTVLPNLHSTACCFPNAWRFFAQLPEYVFSVTADGVRVNLYTDAGAEHRLPDGTPLRIEMQTRYPHEGEVRLRVRPERPARFALGLRVPAWCRGAKVAVANREPASAPAGRYHVIDREWRNGDEVRLDLPMRPEAITSPPEVAANRGQVAFRRGPLVYCLERQDAAGLDLERLSVILDPQAPADGMKAEFRQDLGLYVLKTQAVERPPATTPANDHASPNSQPSPREVVLVPFFFRANRDPDTRWITFLPRQDR